AITNIPPPINPLLITAALLCCVESTWFALWIASADVHVYFSQSANNLIYRVDYLWNVVYAG
ncbi:hypothetical protein, partial [Yersinia pestis]